MKNKLFLLPVFLCGLTSCSIKSEDKSKLFLNYDYKLVRVGDIHGGDPATKEVLTQHPNFTSYISLFNKSKSHINFQCKGSNYNDFHCDTTFALYDKDGNCIAGGDDAVFRTSYVGQQHGTILYEDDEIKQKLGTIYVYTPYWCRWQMEYDVDKSGNKVLLTFEFWKTTYNPLPEWSE